MRWLVFFFGRVAIHLLAFEVFLLYLSAFALLFLARRFVYTLGLFILWLVFGIIVLHNGCFK
jgi:hypothetical protein